MPVLSEFQNFHFRLNYANFSSNFVYLESDLGDGCTNSHDIGYRYAVESRNTSRPVRIANFAFRLESDLRDGCTDSHESESHNLHFSLNKAAFS